MISNILACKKMVHNLSPSCVMTDAPPDEAAISAEASAMGWVIIGGVIAPSIGGVIGPSIGTVSGELAAEMAGDLTKMTVCEFVTLPEPLEELLLFSWTSLRCLRTALLRCRPLQA